MSDIYSVQTLAGALNDDLLDIINRVNYLKECYNGLSMELPVNVTPLYEYHLACLQLLINDLENRLIEISWDNCEIHGLNENGF